MLRAILVTELEEAIINRLRMGTISMRGIVLNSLDLPYTPEVAALRERLTEECGIKNCLEKELEKKTNKKMQERILKAYRDAGYMEPIEFGTGKAIKFLHAVPSEQ